MSLTKLMVLFSKRSRCRVWKGVPDGDLLGPTGNRNRHKSYENPRR